MAFMNENVLPLEQAEASEFFSKARVALRRGYSKFDRWTVDRERDMALIYEERGRDTDFDSEIWYFLDRKGKYYLSIKRISESKTSPEEIVSTRMLLSVLKDSVIPIEPDAETIACIKEAMQESSRAESFELEHYKRSHLTLVDRAGKEI